MSLRINPMDYHPPCEPITRFTISFEYDEETNRWSAYSKEWKCETFGNSATEAGSKITGDIDSHNAREKENYE